MALFAGGIDRRGYLLKERLGSKEELEMALHEVAAGHSYLDPGLIGPILEHQERRDPQLRTLTPREHQILAMVAEGKTNVAIAEAAGHEARGGTTHQFDLLQGRLG